MHFSNQLSITQWGTFDLGTVSFSVFFQAIIFGVVFICPKITLLFCSKMSFCEEWQGSCTKMMRSCYKLSKKD